MVAASQTLEADGEVDVARPDNILDLKIGEFRIEPKLLDDTRVFATRELAIVFRLGTSHDHLTRGKHEGGRLWLSYTHNYGRETLTKTPTGSRQLTREFVPLDYTLHSGVQRDGLQVKTALEVDGGNHVPTETCQLLEATGFGSIRRYDLL